MKKTTLLGCILVLLLNVPSSWALGDLPPLDFKLDLQGLWWGASANGIGGNEAGWGMNIAHQGNTLFATWFTYDSDGEGMWLVMPNLQRQAYKGLPDKFVGEIFRTRGPAFDADPWDPAEVEISVVGWALLAFTSEQAGQFTYTVDGVTQTKMIARQVFGLPVPKCVVGGARSPTPIYTDLWWRSPPGSESGWGLNIEHQGDILFMTWFTYDDERRGAWLVMSNGVRTAEHTYSGTLYRTRGPAFYAQPWDPSQVTLAAVGRATLTFTGNNDGELEYVLDGASQSKPMVIQSKPITRQAFASPASECR